MINPKQVEQSTASKRDIFFWIVAIVLLVGGIAAYYYFRDVAWALRAAVGIVLVCVIFGLLALTHQGKQVIQFAKEARAELRKVVWPTRQETIQTTLVVIAMVVVMALILWGIDSILMWIVNWLSGGSRG